jgi:hypothetical protein
MSRRFDVAERDQDVSPFGGSLMRFCESSGALGAALVDKEGETVDYAGRLSPFDIRVAAAEWRLVLALIAACRVPSWRHARQLQVRASLRSYFVAALSDGYAIVALMPRHSFRVSARALSELTHDVAVEAGWPELNSEGSGDPQRWLRIGVRTDERDRRRPIAVFHQERWCPVDIIGRYGEQELLPDEVGFRARLATGAEFALVREPLGKWFADRL